jgi:hypothetical protein
MLWTEQTDKQLAEAAEAGHQGQGSVVETQRRLRFAMEILEMHAGTLSRRIAWLTWVLVGFSLVVAALVAVIVYEGA